MASDRPRTPTRISGQWPALALAIAVHVAFVGVLVFSLRWQNRKPEPVTALLYAPPPKAAVVEATAPTPPSEAKPQPKPEPVPEPKPEPKPEPIVAPTPPKVEHRVEKPDLRAAAIAEKAKKDEDERRKREQAARDKKDREKKEAIEREVDKKKRDEQQRVVEARERQKGEADALRAQAEREQSVRARQQASEAEAAARTRAEADYIRRIQTKVKGNVTLPPDIVGNPEAIFDVLQLPTGEIIDAALRKSSGSRAYDDAVARAIAKSSPLPRPERPDLFQRTLTLKFRPQD